MDRISSEKHSPVNADTSVAYDVVNGTLVAVLCQKERRRTLREHDRLTRWRRRKGRTVRRRSTRRRTLGPIRRPSGRATCPRAHVTDCRRRRWGDALRKRTTHETHSERPLLTTTPTPPTPRSPPPPPLPPTPTTATIVDDDVAATSNLTATRPTHVTHPRWTTTVAARRHRTRDVYGHVCRQKDNTHNTQIN